MSTATSNSKNVLNSDVEINGNLKFVGELNFDGKLEGEIQAEGGLNLGDSAVITGNISAQSVIVRGKVNGNIVAKDKIETLGMGKTQPIPAVKCEMKAMKELIACLAPNRRVEVEVKGEAIKR
mgnify:CR=1 FL=1